MPSLVRSEPEAWIDTRFVCHELRVVKNVTVTLDPEVARWARVRAAERDISVSRFLGELLQREMQRESAYESAMREWLVREARPLSAPGDVYPNRDQLHERDRLR